MERVVEDFILYLHETKNTSKNTEVSYERDLKKLIRYLQEQGFDAEGAIDRERLGVYVGSGVGGMQTLVDNA